MGSFTDATITAIVTAAPEGAKGQLEGERMLLGSILHDLLGLGLYQRISSTGLHLQGWSGWNFAVYQPPAITAGEREY